MLPLPNISIITIKIASQILRIYISLYFLTQLKTLTVEFSLPNQVINVHFLN